MSETTLTKDVLDQLRASIVAVYASAEASFAAYREAELPVPREVVKLLAMKHESCWVPQAMFDALQAERDALAAQLTEVTRELDEAKRAVTSQNRSAPASG